MPEEKSLSDVIEDFAKKTLSENFVDAAMVSAIAQLLNSNYHYSELK